jgi:prepilin-type N-terminal cleavage/methylation domain-containing protein
MSKKKWRQGVTLTELLVVLAIIGLLATIAVPVYVNKMEQAKVTTAKHEVRELANAEEVCGIMHGFYVPLNMLDDLPYRSENRPAVVDDIENTQNILNCYFISTGVPIYDQDTNQLRLSDYTSIKAVSNLYFGWQGPFMNFKRYYLGDGVYVEPPDPLAEDVARDYPLDPWGNPYIMVTELGYVSPIGRITSTNIGATESAEREFDRMAIISLGPDGSVQSIQDDSYNYQNITAEDDIWVYFGSSGLRPETYY